MKAADLEFHTAIMVHRRALCVMELQSTSTLDLQQLLTTHEVTWSKRDRFCKDQYIPYDQPEEFPTMPVQTSIRMLDEPKQNLSFEKFNFDREVDWNE